MAVSSFSTRGEVDRRVLSEKSEAKGPRKSIQWISQLSNLRWKGGESCGRQGEQSTLQNSAVSREGGPGNCSTSMQEEGKGDGCLGGIYRWPEAQTLFTKQTLDEVIQGKR